LDRLDGGDEDDLLVAGVPSIVGLYDLDDFSPARLHGAFAWWSAADDAYDQRATVAERGADAVYLSSQQLFDDAAVDRLAGGGGRDLWVTNDQPGGGASGGVFDDLVDRVSDGPLSERLVDLRPMPEGIIVE
jgi:hypothetical protein